MTALLRLLPVVLAACLLALGCAGDATEERGAQPRPAGTAVDAAFVHDMPAHHEMALEMAAEARRTTRRRALAGFAAHIDRVQRAEIATMRELRGELPPAPEGGLGMSAHEMGMHPAARAGTPADLAFLDGMIAHHEGAVEMARKVLMAGRHPEVRALATSIARTQHEEVHRMERWRSDWFPRERVADRDSHQ